MKENKSNLKSKKQRIADLKRTRESIRRCFRNPTRSTIENEIGFIEHRLQTADNRLSGKKPDYSSEVKLSNLLLFLPLTSLENFFKILLNRGSTITGVRRTTPMKTNRKMKDRPGT